MLSKKHYRELCFCLGLVFIAAFIFAVIGELRYRDAKTEVERLTHENQELKNTLLNNK